MNWYNNLDIWAIAISFLAFAGSLFTYLSHDRKIKKQETKINEYQLTKIKEEELEKKKAQICGTIIKQHKGRRILKIYNKGKAPAKNIRLEVPDNEMRAFNGTDLLTYSLLNPIDFYEVELYSFIGNINILHLKIHWDDDFQKNNTFSQELQLL